MTDQEIEDLKKEVLTLRRENLKLRYSLQLAEDSLHKVQKAIKQSQEEVDYYSPSAEVVTDFLTKYRPIKPKSLGSTYLGLSLTAPSVYRNYKDCYTYEVLDKAAEVLEKVSGTQYWAKQENDNDG